MSPIIISALSGRPPLFLLLVFRQLEFLLLGASAGLADRLGNDPDALRRARESGELVGCGDRIVYVDKQIEPTTQPLNAAFRQLFAAPGILPFEGRELHNQIAGKIRERNLPNQPNIRLRPLRFVRAEIQGNIAMVYLEGSIIGVGTCADPRIEAQIIFTARQFPNIREVKTFLNGAEFSWEKWMDQRG